MGKTLQEVRAAVLQDEFQTWAAYVEENGPLNPSLRIEAAIARAVVPFLRNATVKDMMPWPRQPEPEATPERIFMMFQNLASASSRRKH